MRDTERETEGEGEGERERHHRSSLVLTPTALPIATTDTGDHHLGGSEGFYSQGSRFSFRQRTGPMLHYINGEEVKGDAATNSKVIHVHKICIEWAPQTYFVGETVKNLKAEMARASKIKCSRCGKSGAALGCFEKSCHKSYHLPCAVEILGCRWDIEDFLMLCPNHSLVKFPREMSKFGKLASEKQHFVPTEMWEDHFLAFMIRAHILSTHPPVLFLKKKA